LPATKLLVEKGSNIELQDNNGWNALHFASYAGRYDVVAYLIRVVANINIQTKYNRSALHLAIEAGQTKIVELLLQNGALGEKEIKGIQDSIQLLPKTVTVANHTHSLSLVPKVNDGFYKCEVCQQSGGSGSAYNCEPCKFNVHPFCAKQ